MDSLLEQSTRMSVGFSGLKIHCLIGTLPHEQQEAQEISIHLKILLHPNLPILDTLSSIIDYSLLAQMCKHIAHLRHYALLETLATQILEEMFLRFSFAYGWIRIEKGAALANAQHAFVEYEKGAL